VLLISRFYYSNDLKMKIIDFFEENGWITDKLREDTVKEIFKYNDPVYPLSWPIYQWALDNMITEEFSYNVIGNRAVQVYEWLAQNGKMSRSRVVKQLYSSGNGMLDICLKHDIDLVQDMRLLDHIITIGSEEQIRLMIGRYIGKNKYDPVRSTYEILIQRCPDLVPDEYLCNVLDTVLFHGSLKTIRYILDKGIKFPDKEYRIYVPCPNCYNGEGHSCNWRYVSANFIVNCRFENFGLEKLNDNPESLPELYNFWVAYGYFVGPCDDEELYIQYGTNETGWDDESEQRTWETPPVHQFRDKKQKATSMPNHIPTYFIPLR